MAFCVVGIKKKKQLEKEKILLEEERD